MIEMLAMQGIIWALLVTGLVVLVALVAFAAMASLAGQASLSWAVPTLVREGYPILDMLRFFTDRRNFYLDGVAASRSGHFSFYFGKHYIIGVSGLEGRKIFYESKALDMSEG
ncbi:hypothetical protein BKA61DRAFT_337419 [Leptodontidium sp. MPI-SDFR-AT-0119]|nr:hypothetical protein BKA61DRAFT_337419 [Leptodontidium sp. MPI-SDFR-AT-0119]